MILVRTFEPSKLISYSVQTYDSWFFYNQGNRVTFICCYDFWFYNQGEETQHLCLRFLMQHSLGDGATILDHV